MSRFKFRAWDTFTEKMVFEGFHVIGEVTCFNGIEQYGDEHPNPKYESSLMRLNDFILMQFTGLSDKNGTDIYEGDIIKQISFHTGKEHYWIYKVGLVEGRGNNLFALLLRDNLASNGNCDYTYKIRNFDIHSAAHIPVSKDIEVIGNIYENSGLIES